MLYFAYFSHIDSKQINAKPSDARQVKKAEKQNFRASRLPTGRTHKLLAVS